MAELPNKELRDAIKAAAIAADVADPVFATAKAIEAFTKGEFADADQATSWFDLLRVKSPKLWESADTENGNGAAATKVKGEDNPWAANFKGTIGERDKALEKYITTHGIAASHRMAKSAHTTVGRPLKVA